MMSKPKVFKDQSGAVALITVILLMFVFLVITLGFLRLAVNEQRNSSDVDLNSRAYYAAESGIEDARRILGQFYSDGTISTAERNQLRGDTCSAASPLGVPENSVLSDDLETKITCQLIDTEPGDYIASLGVNQSALLPLIPADTDPSNPVTPADVASVKIEWHSSDDGSVVARSSAETDLPNVGCWNSGENSVSGGVCSGDPYAAMLRTGLFTLPMSGSISRASLTNKISYLNPVDGAGTVTAAAFETKIGGTNSVSNSPSCSTGAGGPYVCTLTISDLNLTGAAVQNYLRITPIYKGTTVKVTMYDGSGDPLSFSDVQAKIDVTAQAGDVIRRIETRIPLSTLDLLPDEAITTADQLCKQVVITGGGGSGLRATDSCPAN